MVAVGVVVRVEGKVDFVVRVQHVGWPSLGIGALKYCCSLSIKGVPKVCCTNFFVVVLVGTSQEDQAKISPLGSHQPASPPRRAKPAGLTGLNGSNINSRAAS